MRVGFKAQAASVRCSRQYAKLCAAHHTRMGGVGARVIERAAERTVRQGARREIARVLREDD